MGKVRVLVYDRTGATYQTTLNNAESVKWQHPLAGEGQSAGVATFSLMASDSKAAQVVRDRIVKMHWMGAIRCGFRIRTITRVLTDQGFRLDVTAIQIRCLLGDARALPAYGVRPGAGETRRFGFMSPDGAWRVGAEWVTPATTPLASYAPWTTKGYPQGFPDGSAMWLRPPTHNAAGNKTWYRRTFTTSLAYETVRLWVAVDDTADVYFDNELVLQIQGSATVYQQAAYVDVPLPAGPHVLAVEIRDENQFSGEDAISELLCCMGVISTSSSGSDPDAVTVTTMIMRSDTHTTWTVRYGHSDDPGWRRAQVVKQLFTEATARGARGCAALTLDFTDSLDTSGASWSDRGDFEVQTLDDPLDRITESLFDPFLDWDVDAATMKVQAWKRRGQDRTTGGSPVVLALRPKRTDLSITETYDVTTSLYGRTADGLVVHESDSTAETEAGGVVEGGMSLGSVASENTASDLLGAHLASLGYPTTEVAAALSPNGPVMYVDCGLGDTVAIPDGQGGYLPVRITCITVDASGDTVVAYPDLALDRTVTL